MDVVNVAFGNRDIFKTCMLAFIACKKRHQLTHCLKQNACLVFYLLTCASWINNIYTINFIYYYITYIGEEKSQSILQNKPPTWYFWNEEQSNCIIFFFSLKKCLLKFNFCALKIFMYSICALFSRYDRSDKMSMGKVLYNKFSNNKIEHKNMENLLIHIFVLFSSNIISKTRFPYTNW